MSITRFRANARMSQSVVYNGVVYLAGQVGAPGQDVKTQTRAILRTVDTLLTEAGTDRSQILQATIWLADMGDFEIVNKVWDNWIGGGGPPARATGGVQLASADYLVEIIIVAASSQALIGR